MTLIIVKDIDARYNICILYETVNIFFGIPVNEGEATLLSSNKPPSITTGTTESASVHKEKILSSSANPVDIAIGVVFD